MGTASTTSEPAAKQVFCPSIACSPTASPPVFPRSMQLRSLESSSGSPWTVARSPRLSAGGHERALKKDWRKPLSITATCSQVARSYREGRYSNDADLPESLSSHGHYKSTIE